MEEMTKMLDKDLLKAMATLINFGQIFKQNPVVNELSNGKETYACEFKFTLVEEEQENDA